MRSLQSLKTPEFSRVTVRTIDGTNQTVEHFAVTGQYRFGTVVTKAPDGSVHNFKPMAASDIVGDTLFFEVLT